MNYQQLIENMTPEIYTSLRKAVELGKWPDGKPVTPEQREHAMQAIIAWGEQHLPAEQRIGYIDKGHKEGDNCDDPVETPLNWK
ncbi:hypothetical protein BST95_10190 [Halioglobus japonicus]|uniref:DUF1315 domain-containing protein n=1 Tax=Halioglobus japonicus TaxID=930805 RepID=A0AAP8MF17_9GAMM|nr:MULTISPECIES: DUF1315 family protein [Halioglobus]AQA18547.1 hypothetical protein BST95_10190 [Halioglobus japonicus]KZX58786.1 hypothetical protein A3709_17475 [Halioglobus sp. HI00S01]PLW86570.1 DUF1315 domain-containing protein [Halioglobus japonicus]GHD12203.1 hypothetical protein GCM10007052_12770 [Halioglobus japonicus]